MQFTDLVFGQIRTGLQLTQLEIAAIVKVAGRLCPAMVYTVVRNNSKELDQESLNASYQAICRGSPPA